MKPLVKPRRLRHGDTIAVVSLSWGGLGDPEFIHKYRIAKERLERDFGLRVIAMPNALAGSDFVYAHPELRARDLMDAFADDSVASVFCAIGGDDTIRLLPYIDFDVLRAHPKIFMGYSDSTINHFMMHKAGLVSFYGPSVMAELGEYGKICDYTADAVRTLLFDAPVRHEVKPSPLWSDDLIPWDEANIGRTLTMKSDPRGYELLQGKGVVRGHILGGCIDVFMMASGTGIWPEVNDWRGAILLIETSEDKPSPDFVRWALRNLAAQGILQVLSGMIVGKPQGEVYYEEYKDAILSVLAEAGRRDLPVLYNLNIGHAKPTGVLPLGTLAEIDCGRRSLTLVESAVL
ncbi:MAG: LD-carboxypeptidase [Clostridia bacterium]|nr:LD-carboxypeptidase [Clostridia bacterium]